MGAKFTRAALTKGQISLSIFNYHGGIMSIIGKSGKSISRECQDLIQEVQKDVAEFGGDVVVYSVYVLIDGVKIYTNYRYVLCNLHIVDISSLCYTVV